MSSAPWHPVPIRLVDEVMPHLRDTELRVLLVVLRQTLGWQADPLARETGHKETGHKRRDWISHRQMCIRTGRGSEAVSGAISALARSGFLVVEDSAGQVLETPEQRRRCLGRLYFRAGDMWITPDNPRLGKPKTTTDGINKRKSNPQYINTQNNVQNTMRTGGWCRVFEPAPNAHE